MMTQGGAAAAVQILTVILVTCFHMSVSETVLGDICKYGILSNGHRSVVTRESYSRVTLVFVTSSSASFHDLQA